MIKNAADTLLSSNTGTLPDMSSALFDYLQPMVFEVITKNIVNFQSTEVAAFLNLNGVIQPFSAAQLLIKPEGQRAWAWYMLHADTSTLLKNDDAVKYLNIQYRVMSTTDYSAYGYVEYHLISDYVGTGP